METKENKSGIILQIAAAVVLGTAAIAILTFFSQYRLETNSKNNESGQFASRVAQEVIRSVKEYQAYDWLLQYWHANYGAMDVEYEADFSHGTKTEEKVRLLAEHQPDFMVRYASKEDILALPEEDQKLYAEIAYSWLITRVDEIKQNYNISFLYLVLTDTEGGENPYQYQLFLVSGADEDSVRGTDKHEVYPMGMYVSIADNAELQEAMEFYGLRSVDNDILTMTLVAPSVSTTIDTSALRREDPDTYDRLIEVYPKKTERRASIRMKLK